MSGRGILPIDEQTKRATLESLPPSLREIAETIGLHLVIRLVQEFGGTELKVPATIQPMSELERRFGAEDANVLARALGGERIYVPRSLIRAEWKDAEIKRLTAKKWRQKDIALAVGVTDRWVRQVVSDDRAATPTNSVQADLFQKQS